MLPDPLHSRLPAIVRGACFVVTRCPADPRLSPGYQWTAAERPHVVSLAPWRSATDGLNPGCHRLRAKGSDSALDYDKARRGGR